ncbi:hypothetical protein EYF80_066447 [Liparis tanakae]|uniref:Uncharacterized protein n=1 Tax=Liparis tanakae TaxID=230148 RepID=A0A4Z2E509_9TELE|nr:hypothetical protein EYF80_066447 [Liparis tanakae]
MDEDSKTVERGQSTWEKSIIQDQERRLQTQLGRNALGGQHLLQMKENELQKAQQERQSKTDMEVFVLVKIQEKQKKEKAEKNAEALQSISDHRLKMIQEREQREEAKHQRNAALLQDQKDADRSFLEDKELKAQRIRKEKLQFINLNDSLQAEILQIQQTPMRKDPVKLLNKGHKDIVHLCPTPPPAELKKDSQRTSWVRKLISSPEAVSVNHRLESCHLNSENRVLAELRTCKKQTAEAEEDGKIVKEGQSELEKIIRQDQERDCQTKLCRNALAKQHLLQIKEKKLQKAKEEQNQHKKDMEMAKKLNGLHTLELIQQEDQHTLLKQVEHKRRVEDISRKNSDREKKTEILRTEKERTKLACIEMEGKLLQRKADATVRYSRHSLTSLTVEHLAFLKKEQAAATAERDEKNVVNGLAKRQAQQEKQQKEKAEKNAEALRSISDHRLKMRQEREQREEAQRQSNAAWLQDQKDADRSFLEEKELKAQRIRKEKVQLNNFNNSLHTFTKLPPPPNKQAVQKPWISTCRVTSHLLSTSFLPRLFI